MEYFQELLNDFRIFLRTLVWLCVGLTLLCVALTAWWVARERGRERARETEAAGAPSEQTPPGGEGQKKSEGEEQGTEKAPAHFP